MRRYLRLVGNQIRASFLLTLQYRVDLAVNVALAFFWTAAALAPLVVLFNQRTNVAGWTFGEALVVIAWFNVLKGLLGGVIQPSVTQVIEHIRKGTLDFVLIKPADAQLLLSTSRFEFQRLADTLAGFAVLAYALMELRHVPSFGAIVMTGVLLLCALAILYAIWILVTSLAFTFVKVDNLSYLFASIYDAARWPAPVFRGALAFFFTFVLPLTIMTTYPALAVLDRIAPTSVLTALVIAATFLFISRRVWLYAIRGYTSAGG